MQQEVIISGFGGQGALFSGQLLAHAAMASGNEVTWIPSYGPEMRGGKARCTVVVSDEGKIGSPLVRQPSGAIVLNLPSMEAFASAVKTDGVLVVNSSLVPLKSERTDIRIVYLPATDIAIEMGDVRMANVLLLGALVEATGIVSLDAVAKALEDNLPARHRKVLPLNYEALKRGAAAATEA